MSFCCRGCDEVVLDGEDNGSGLCPKCREVRNQLKTNTPDNGGSLTGLCLTCVSMDKKTGVRTCGSYNLAMGQQHVGVCTDYRRIPKAATAAKDNKPDDATGAVKRCGTCTAFNRALGKYGTCTPSLGEQTRTPHEDDYCTSWKPRPDLAWQGDTRQPTGQKHDAGKPGGFSLIPVEARTAMAAVLSYGQKKYGKPSGWRSVPNAAERYRDALDRHMLAVDSGEECDPESGLPHLWHVLCNAAFLVALREANNGQQ